MGYVLPEGLLEQVRAEARARQRAKRELTDLDLEDRIHDAEVAANDGRVIADPHTPGLLDTLKTGAWLDAQDFPPLQYAVPGIVPEGFTLLVGAPKVGKSWATLDIALGIAVGGVALGRLRTGDPRPVLVCALEDGERRLQDRCRRLLTGAPIPPMFYYFTHIEPDSVFATINEWLGMWSPTDRPTVILDTLGKVMPPTLPGESAYGRDYRIGSLLKRLADDHPGAAVIVPHHDRKAASADFIDSVSGTHGLAGAADTTVVLARNRHEAHGLIKVTGRDVVEAEYAVRIIDGIAWQLDGDDLQSASRRATEVRATAHLGDRSVEVFAYVNEHPEGVTPKQTDAALGIPAAKVYLGRLHDTGRIRKLKRGLYAPSTPVASVPLLPTEHDESNAVTEVTPPTDADQ